MGHGAATLLHGHGLLDKVRAIRYAPSDTGHPTRANRYKMPREQTMTDSSTQTELEAAAFRRLVSHLRERNDVQNIDMMNLAGFCRNCLSRWYREAATDKGMEMDDAAARDIVYGMDYAEWKATYQTEATAEQRAAYDKTHKHD
tara:strand:- start:563 stop:994 length:432 start_codon:yes stop_codon:yes gene_type:complete